MTEWDTPTIDNSTAMRWLSALVVIIPVVGAVLAAVL